MIQTHFSGMTEPVVTAAAPVKPQRVTTAPLPVSEDTVHFGAKSGKGRVRNGILAALVAVGAPLGLALTATPAAAEPFNPLNPWEIQELEKRVDSLEVKQGQQDESLAKLEGKINEVKQETGNYSSGLVEVREQIKNLGADPKVNERLAALEETVKGIQAKQEGIPKAEDIAALKTGQNDLKTQVAKLQKEGELTAEQADQIAKDLDTKLAGLEQKLDAANKQIEASRAQIVSETSEQVRSSQEWKMLTGMAVGGGVAGGLGLLIATIALVKMSALSRAAKSANGAVQQPRQAYQPQPYTPTEVPPPTNG